MSIPFASDSARKTSLDQEKPQDDVLVIESLDRTTAVAQQMSEEHFASVEKRLKRKLDIRLAAMIVFIYMLNYLDRVCVHAPAAHSISQCSDELA